MACDPSRGRARGRRRRRRSRAAEAFLVYLQCATGDLEALRSAIQFKRTWKRALRDDAGMSPEEAARVRGFPITDRQRGVLAELDDILGEPDEGLRSRGRAIASVLSSSTRTWWLCSRRLLSPPTRSASNSRRLAKPSGCTRPGRPTKSAGRPRSRSWKAQGADSSSAIELARRA